MIKFNWREYLIEAWGLGTFMLVASMFGTLIYAPASAVNALVTNYIARGLLMGLLMGMTSIILIYSPWGKRSGAHFNPAVTLTFYRLKKLRKVDTFFYIIFQFIGGLLGILLASLILGQNFTEPPLDYLVTLPGKFGPSVAFFTELILAFGLILTVLVTSNINRVSNYTGYFASILITVYILVAAPISGMSINPARSFASAVPAGIWDFFWIYYFAPPLGMLLAAEIYRRYFPSPKTICCKMCPNNEQTCIAIKCCDQCDDFVRQWRTN
ncbi:MIP/aquaporin family protein [Gloeocapsa sp. PCC 73106]|uniref:MIP/aquaporin family protein n=1 Tax=Gloeocapsa sp. PCC 73106 TaxID=102232 RepID=UPI0002ABB432|nr:aquaporin [Gloeocapsa sp. PCC 73106]ELS00195.1 permease, glycerol uptake facilitator [Gloeocapsa sp. PCC 73106]